MLKEQTLEKLYALKLNGMADAFKEQLQQPSLNELTFEERFGFIVDQHWTWKEDCKLKRFLRNAALKINACMEDIDYKTPRGLDKSVMMRLSSCDWIERGQNIIITGPTGAGKTYLACALANQACRHGHSSLYRRTTRLFQEVAMSRADGSYPKLINKLSKAKVLVLDDFCISEMKAVQRHELLEIIEERSDLSSLILATQVPIKEWFGMIGDPTIADAVLDRIIHNAHKIKLKGESMRKIRSSLTNKNSSGK